MTAELVASLTEDEAERLTLRISTKLGVLADSYESVMPLIREAIDRNAHEVLGYPSVGAYAADRFGETLTRLGVEMRRDVVKELTAAGMSTRAIAPIVGVSDETVRTDRLAGAKNLAPAPSNVIGLDGKRYTPPAPQPKRKRIESDPEVVSRWAATENLNRVCMLAELPERQQREHAAAWARQVERDDTTLTRLDGAITYLTLLREEMTR